MALSACLCPLLRGYLPQPSQPCHDRRTAPPCFGVPHICNCAFKFDHFGSEDSLTLQLASTAMLCSIIYCIRLSICLTCKTLAPHLPRCSSILTSLLAEWSSIRSGDIHAFKFLPNLDQSWPPNPRLPQSSLGVQRNSSNRIDKNFSGGCVMNGISR